MSYQLGRLAGPGEVTDPHGVGAQADAPANPFERVDGTYEAVRPEYPPSIVEAIVTSCERDVPRIGDVGAGTGKMTRLLSAAGADVWAIEPAPAMVSQLARYVDASRIRQARAEATGLEDDSLEALVYAQSWHWLDARCAAAEAARVLTASGTVWIVFNQLDVRVEWVRRLTRIMRSGDVHRPDKPPLLGPNFGAPALTMRVWEDALTPAEVMALARTRSSYLRSSESGRAHMQANLRWYLGDHLGYGPGQPIRLPYYTLAWRFARA
ncbi:MAG: methyltransferase domain-containing protein [Actinomycetaceae bacterium]|nr:methyltransferase domain-containing protein [Actinomycetaceae bacterium]